MENNTNSPSLGEREYYIPTIDEFHIGFEYQVLEDPRTNEGWGETITCDNRSIKYCTDENSDTEYRVKCLDREDIESIGEFEFEKSVLQDFYRWENFQEKPEVYGYRIWHLRIQHRPDTKWLKLIGDFEDGCESVLFEGKCKNKSELINILKMIGYNV